MLNLSEKLRDVPQEVRDAFKHDHFLCPECGGTLLPFSLAYGVCVQCSTETDLNECEYETEESE